MLSHVCELTLYLFSLIAKLNHEKDLRQDKKTVK